MLKTKTAADISVRTTNSVMHAQYLCAGEQHDGSFGSLVRDCVRALVGEKLWVLPFQISFWPYSSATRTSLAGGVLVGELPASQLFWSWLCFLRGGRRVVSNVQAW